MEYAPVACMRQSSRCCRTVRAACRAFPPGAGDGHALAGAHADEIGFELGEGGEDIEEQLSHGIARVVERPAEGQVEAGSGAGGAGEAVIGVDAILDDAELQERLALGGRTLPVGGTARVSDERCRHGGEVYE